jgi:hypothetical protein
MYSILGRRVLLLASLVIKLALSCYCLVIRQCEFDVDGSVHLGNVYDRLGVQLDAHCIYPLFLYILLCMFRVLFALILRSTNCRVQP